MFLCLFPGFEDVSPEELRLEAYEAEKAGAIQPYVSFLHAYYIIMKANVLYSAPVCRDFTGLQKYIMKTCLCHVQNLL